MTKRNESRLPELEGLTILQIRALKQFYIRLTGDLKCRRVPGGNSDKTKGV